MYRYGARQRFWDTCTPRMRVCKQECMRAADMRGRWSGFYAAQPSLASQSAREGDLQLLGGSHLPAHEHGHL